MKYKIFKSTILLVIIFFTFCKVAFSEVIKNFKVNGNQRISDETIIMFSETKIAEKLDEYKLNQILKNLYQTNFFDNVSIVFENNILTINVKENPIIEKINFEGIKSNKIKDLIKKNTTLRSRSSFDQIILKRDKENINNILKDLGYFFPLIDTYVESLEGNKVNITYNIVLGDKAKIKKISFIGDKKIKDKKLKSIIVSEESKFWKFISNKKFVNERVISLDKRLLKNYYLNKGYYDVVIDSSFAKLVNKKEFELIFNIQANKKYFFNDLQIKLPNDFDETNFISLSNLFSKLKGEPYSIYEVENILEEIDKITLDSQFQSITANVKENIIEDKINLEFIIKEIDTKFVERINVFGNNVTKEAVIRNQLELDEGDPFNEILANKSINNLKNLNFFKNVSSEIVDGNSDDTKQINITVEEKPTGEISAGAGVGTSGSSVSFGVKENNYLGSGVALSSNITLTDESLKGLLSVNNPNFNNTDKSVYFTAEAIEIDRLKAYGYKTNKTGFSLEQILNI